MVELAIFTILPAYMLEVPSERWDFCAKLHAMSFPLWRLTLRIGRLPSWNRFKELAFACRSGKIKRKGSAKAKFKENVEEAIAKPTG